jgi:DNA-binding FadR family transcriptional regulator
MPLRAIENRSLADEVFNQICDEIVSGRYEPGHHLMAERMLAEVFGVNRHVVREAIKRLEQIGLVKVSQGGGTKVLDFKRHAGLDFLAMMTDHPRTGEDVLKYWLSVIEMRAAIAADVAKLCARRASEESKRELVTISAEMKRTTARHTLYLLEVRFWEKVVDGSANIAYRLAYNSLVKGASALPDRAHQWTAYELEGTGHRIAIAEAIASGNEVLAEAETRKAMQVSLDFLTARYEAAKDGARKTDGGVGPESATVGAPSVKRRRGKK